MVEINSIGAEILCLMVPDEKGLCLVVRLLEGIGDETSEVLVDLFEVKDLDSDIVVEVVSRNKAPGQTKDIWGLWRCVWL